jgi:hypothetical protein
MCKIVWITLIICATVILCILVSIRLLCNFHKRKIELKNEHEKNLIELEFRNKKEWEEMIQAHYKTKESTEELKKDIIKKVVEKLNKPSQIDMDKVAMIHLLLSGNMEPITAENLDAEIKKVEKTYQLLKDKVS